MAHRVIQDVSQSVEPRLKLSKLSNEGEEPRSLPPKWLFVTILKLSLTQLTK